MKIKVGDMIKEVEKFNQLSLEQFYEQTQPGKLEAFRSLFGIETLTKQTVEIEKESDDLLKEFRSIDVLYRKLIINQVEEKELMSVINKQLITFRYEAVIMVMSMFSSLSVSLSSLELFSLYVIHSNRAKTIEEAMINYLNNDDNGK